MFKVRFLEIETNQEGNILICDNNLCTGQGDFSSRTTCGDLRSLRANVSGNFVVCAFYSLLFEIQLTSKFTDTVEVKCLF